MEIKNQSLAVWNASQEGIGSVIAVNKVEIMPNKTVIERIMKGHY